MKIGIAAVILTALGLLTTLGNSALYAHHAFESEFDVHKPVHIEGKVVQIEWTNPHVYVDIAVKDNQQGTTVWHCELPSINHSIEYGLNRNSLSIGSEVLLDGFAAKSGMQLLGTSTLQIKATGKIVSVPRDDWHHSFAEIYDNAKQVQLTGKVVNMDWTHPTSSLYFTVVAPDGKSQGWIAEIPMFLTLNRVWTKTTLAAGDVIRIDGQAAKDGSRKLLAQNVLALTIAGTTLAAPRVLLEKRP